MSKVFVRRNNVLGSKMIVLAVAYGKIIAHEITSFLS